MKQFNDQDFYLAERAFKNKDTVYFNWFKNGAIKRMDYLKPLLKELKEKGYYLYNISYELNEEVLQLKYLLTKELCKDKTL